MTGADDAPADGFEPPPREFTDSDGRTVLVRRSDGDREALVDMYSRFAPEDRAQGIPPSQESAIRDWLEAVTGEACPAVVAVVDSVVGHAMLVPDGEGAYELAIFVLKEYQSAGIGTHMIEALLGLARAEGVEDVWLTVERWNDPAMRLYKSVGFERVDDGGLEVEMALNLR